MYIQSFAWRGWEILAETLKMTGFWAEILTRKFTNVMEEYYPLKNDVRIVFNFKIKTIFLDLTFCVFLKLNYILKIKSEWEKETERDKTACNEMSWASSDWEISRYNF
jgi:hypothetical protein